MKIKPNNEMKQAAYLCGLPVNVWIMETLYKGIAHDMATAHEALVKCGLRNEAQMNQLRDEAVRKLEMQAKRSKAKRKTNRHHPSDQYQGNLMIADAAMTAPCPTVDGLCNNCPTPSFCTSVMETKRNVVEHDGGYRRGLIADYKGSFFGKYKRHTTLNDAAVWQCHKDVEQRYTSSDGTMPRMEADELFDDVVIQIYYSEDR